MGLLLYRMQFPLKYDESVGCILDANDKLVTWTSYETKEDMEYLVLAANEKHARDNHNELDMFIETIEQEWK